MKKSMHWFMSSAILTTAGLALAYDPDITHPDLTEAAVLKSALNTDSSLVPRLGLGQFAQKREFIIARMQFGAKAEDTGNRPLNHFFDFVNDRPLTVLGLFGGRKSPDWALEDLADIPDQFSSYKDAKGAFYNALTLDYPSPVTAQANALAREGSWGLSFQYLGQVLHHIQDMAQPQHVRNDAHCDAGLLACGVFFSNPSRYERYTANKNEGIPTRINEIANDPGTDPVYPGVTPGVFKTPRDFWVNNGGTGIARFTSTNFVSQGTNFQMLSGQPVAAKFALPVPINSPASIPITQVYTDAGMSVPPDIQALCGNGGTACLMTFYPTAMNPRASTLSMFDQDLSTAGIPVTYTDGVIMPIYTGDRLFSLNRFTFDAVYPLLIPQAVSYSAGLINFFFRGQMEISLPDDGVYGIIDHNVAANSNPVTGGFPKIKLKLKNVTPGVDAQGNPGIEPMAEGATPTLVAIAKFHRNHCHRADLSGELTNDGSANDWHTCRSSFEEIVVSDPAPVPAGINTGAQPVTFTFTNKRIPISATDLYLQVVYRGQLGAETDAVVVATKDISEPTYIYNYSRWDQYTYCSYCTWPVLSISRDFSSVSASGGSGEQKRMTKDMSTRHTYAQWCDVPPTFPTLDACNQANGLTIKLQYSATSNLIPGYDPALYSTDWTDIANERPLSPVATMTAPVGTLARIAVLFDATPTNTALEVFEAVDNEHSRGSFTWATGTFSATNNQLDTTVTPNTLTPAVPYLPGRGVYLPSSENWLLISGDASPRPPLTLVPSQINF